jgi:hypothetical protein
MRAVRGRGFLIVVRSREKGVRNYVRNTRSGSDCSLVAWILGVSRFERAHSCPVGDRYRYAPPAPLQRQISHSVNDGTSEGRFSIFSYRVTRWPTLACNFGKIHGMKQVRENVSSDDRHHELSIRDVIEDSCTLAPRSLRRSDKEGQSCWPDG